MDIKLTEEQTQLKDMAAKYMDNTCGFDFVRRMEEEDGPGFCRDMWREFAEMGWLGIIVPEEYDGMGMSTLDMVILIRELGRHICPSPYLFTSVLAADLLAGAGTELQKKSLLPEIVAGEKIYALAYQEFSRKFTPTHIKLEATRDRDNYTLNGSKLFVEFADGADTLIVAARTGEADSASGLTLFLVDRNSAGVRTTHMPTMSRDRHYQVDFNGVSVSADNIIGNVDNGWSALEPALHKAVVAFCAYTNGAGFEMHEHATQYARERVQFGRPIGQMQTIQGYLAQMIMELYGADMLTMFTAFQMDRGRHVRGYVGKTKAFSSETVGHVMDQSSQIFGGMGYMEEQDTTLFLRRGKQYQLALGGSEYWEDVIAEEIIDRDPVVLTEHLFELLKPVSAADDFTIGLDEVQSWVDVERHAVAGDFDVERGYFYTTCASVQNGNPLYWDESAITDITDGPTAPLTMLSAWFRPHYWMPGRDTIPLPWETHFELKETLALPEAVATDSEVAFGEPIRPGDRVSSVETLRSLSEVKTTKLGRGRFWVIDCVCRNQHGDWVGTETMTAFGYRKG